MGKGILIGILLHGFQLIIFAGAAAWLIVAPQGWGFIGWGFYAIYLPLLCGFTQFAYMIPAMLIFRKRQPAVTKGIAVVAALGLILNVFVLGVIWSGQAPAGRPLG